MKRWALSLFVAGALVGLAGLLFVTKRVIDEERQRVTIAAEARHEEDMRASLSRMDQRIGTLLTRAVTRTERVGMSEGPFEFRVELPSGELQPILERQAANEALLEQAIMVCSLGSNIVGTGSPAEAGDWSSARWLDPETNEWAMRGQSRSNAEYAQRAQVFQNANTVNFNDNVGAMQQVLENSPRPALVPLQITTGPLVAAWEKEDEQCELVLARVIAEGPRSANQVFRVRWDEVEALLLSELDELAYDARVERVAPSLLLEPEAYLGDCLASVPARLVLPAPELPSGLGPNLRATLMTTWLLAGVGLFALGLAAWSLHRDSMRQRRFRSAVTHELRTPLTTFRMYADMLRSGMVPVERRDEYLETLERESERLEGLVENVLAHARLESGRNEAALERVTLGALLSRVRERTEKKARDAGFEFDWNLGRAEDLHVRTDTEMVEHVLANLFENAFKYGHEGDEAFVELTAHEASDRVILAVSDRGPGIAPQAARRIFRAFDRGGRDESDHVPGVGLGLALARDWARAANADLSLVPSERGARFELALPRA